MLMLSVKKQNERSVGFLTYLLDKNANLGIIDVDGKSALHHLAGVNLRHWPGEQRYNNKEQRLKIQLEVCDLLLARGADRTIKDKKEETPFVVALGVDNAPMVRRLMQGISINEDPQLMHSLASKIMQVKYQEILIDLLNQEIPTAEALNVLDDQGFTPLLLYIRKMTESYDGLSSTLSQLINFEGTSATFENDAMFDEDRIQKMQQNSYNQNRYNGGYNPFGNAGGFG